MAWSINYTPPTPVVIAPPVGAIGATGQAALLSSGSYPSRQITPNTGAVGIASGVPSVASSSQNSGTSTYSGTAFPRFGVQLLVFNQLPTTNAEIALCATFRFIVLGGNYSSAVGGANLTRDQIVRGGSGIVGLKSQPLVGLTHVLPVVVQYEDMPNNSVTAEDKPEHQTVCNANNWWVYTTGSSGAKAIDAGGNLQLMTPIHGRVSTSVQAIAQDPTTGLWPYEWGAQYCHDRYIGGNYAAGGSLATTTTLANMGSIGLDGNYFDNQSLYTRWTGDWERSNTTQPLPSGTTRETASLFNATKDTATHYRAIDSTRLCVGNVALNYGNALGLDTSPLNQVFDYPMQQNLWGRGASASFVNHGWAAVLAMAHALDAYARNGMGTNTASYLPTDYPMMRHDFCMNTLSNGYWMAGCYSPADYDGAGGHSTGMLAQIDEQYGGTIQDNAYMGPALTSDQGQPQTAAWSNGVYRRDFLNAISLVNSTASSQTVTLEATYAHLTSAYGSQAINNGAKVTSVTLGTISYSNQNSSNTSPPQTSNTYTVITAGDACILMRTGTTIDWLNPTYRVGGTALIDFTYVDVYRGTVTGGFGGATFVARVAAPDTEFIDYAAPTGQVNAYWLVAYDSSLTPSDPFGSILRVN